VAAVQILTIPVICSGPGSRPLTASTRYSILALTAGNIAAQQTAAAALATRTQALTHGTVKKSSIAVETSISSAYPSGTANRGEKWILSATNAAGQPYTYTIPAADTTGGGLIPAVLGDGITADFASTHWVNYKGAFEALATDSAGGALTINSAILGGRRR
jgi:hypothetical protein